MISKVFCLYEADPDLSSGMSCAGSTGVEDFGNIKDFVSSDRDADADLTVSIDWDNSEARKNNEVVDRAEYDYTTKFLLDPIVADPATGEVTATLTTSGGWTRLLWFM